LLNTLADYSGNLKTAETTKTLKYGDIKSKLIIKNTILFMQTVEQSKISIL